MLNETDKDELTMLLPTMEEMVIILVISLLQYLPPLSLSLALLPL